MNQQYAISLLGVACMCIAGLFLSLKWEGACRWTAAIGFILIIGGLFQGAP